MASQISGDATAVNVAAPFSATVPDDGDGLNAASVEDNGTSPATGFQASLDQTEYLRQVAVGIRPRFKIGAAWGSWSSPIAANDAYAGDIHVSWTGATAASLRDATSTFNAPSVRLASPLNGNNSGASTDSSPCILTSTTFAVFTAKLAMSAVGANNVTVLFGSVGSGPQGAWFQKESADTNWKCITNDGSATTTTTTTPPVANTPQDFRIELYGSATGSGTRVLFYIDGALKATHTTHVDTTTPMKPYMILAGSGGNATTADLGPMFLTF